MRRIQGPDTPELIAKKIAEGRGRGFGSTYTPWIKVGEIRSNGEQRIVLGRKTGRLHHYLSRGESNHHLFAEFNDKVIDIREQYPVLPVDYTLEVAKKLGVKHPAFNGQPSVITFDFFLTIKQANAREHLVRSIKRSDDLKKVRVLEKLQLEKQICVEQGYRYEVITETQMNPVTLANLKFLWNWTLLQRPLPSDAEIDAFLRALYRQDFEEPLGLLLQRVAKELSMAPSLAIWNFRYLAWEKVVNFNPDEPLQLTSSHQGLQRNVTYGD